jgi:Phosphotransferase enzyme family
MSGSRPFRSRTPKVQHGKVAEEAAQWEPLAGGAISAVFRSGNKVRRASGPNADFVRRLLIHFEQAGFDGAPRHLGTDAEGREILSFIDGHALWRAAEQWKARTDASLAAAARLLRCCHDLTAGTALARDCEVVCHNDLSLQNTVYRDHGSGLVPVAFIDWDLAAPGQRIHDVAHMCWQYPGLSPGGPEVTEAARQVRLISDAYGLTDRSRLIDTILWWQDRCWRGIEAGVVSGDAAMARLVAASVPEVVRLERAWVAANRDVLAATLA